MNFHSKYKKVTPWYRPVTAEFELKISHSRFIGLFDYEYEDDFIKLTKSGFLTIKNGFAWGASGPTLDTKSSREASCVHDALYHLSDFGVFVGKDSRLLRRFSDDLLYKICIENGMWRWRAKMWLRALEIFGGIAWESDQ